MNASTLHRRDLLKSGALVAAGGLLGAPAALASGRPRTGDADPDRHVVMIIRHGEKQRGHTAPYGVSAAGDKDSESLTTSGWARAGGLVNLFAPADSTLMRPGVPRPACVYASNLHGPAGGSRREQETVSLLAEQLGVSIDLDFGVGDEQQLAAALSRAASPALVCWEHHHIPALADALGTAKPVPAKWPGHRFDVIWHLSRTGASERYVLEQIPELILPGDSRRPIT